MKITFPLMGDIHIFARLFFQEIGIAIVPASPNSVKVLERGSLHSPDEICLPFKLMIANLMEAYEKGADIVIMPATMGPCRLGEYGELFKSVLDKKGYSFQWILLDSIEAITKKELLGRLKAIVADSNKSKAEILKALRQTYQIIKKLEALEAKSRIQCGYEVQRGSCKNIIKACKKELEKAPSLKAAIKIIKKSGHEMNKVAMDKDKKPLKILLTGEIYSLIEPFANHYMEETLMDMGICFEKRITIGWWIRRTILNPLSIRDRFQPKNDYLSHEVGGYAKDTVSEGFLCYKGRYDGVIQILPVGCMPEIVAKAVLSNMSKDLKIRVLTIIFDEMAGEAGYITRIEAFVDMLQRKKRIEEKKRLEEKRRVKQGGDKKNVLYGN